MRFTAGAVSVLFVHQLYLFDDMSGMDNPQRTLQGKIVVE
jgi:hypothetical protein